MMSIKGLALFYGGMVRKKNVLATLNADLRDRLRRDSFVVAGRLYHWHSRPGQQVFWEASAVLCSNGMTFMHDPVNKLSVLTFGIDHSRNRLCHVPAHVRRHYSGAHLRRNLPIA